MLTMRVITVGTLKEAYWREAAEEYRKRLSAFCRLEEVQLREARLPDRPSEAQIRAALASEGEEMKPYLTPRAYKIALCVEGQAFSSPGLAERISSVMGQTSEIVLVIGSSFGIAPEIKKLCDLRLSVSELTFPHQMVRVMLYEVLYRSMNILKGTPYHK